MRELHCLWLYISSRITYRFFKAAAAAPARSQIHTHIYLYVVCVWVCGDSALLLASIISHTQGHLQQSQSKRKVEDGRGEAEWVGRLKEKMDLFKKKKGHQVWGQGCFFSTMLGRMTASNTINHWSGLCHGLYLGWVTPRDTLSPDSLFN